ncbi:hypothetical protein [Gelidibacter japonicus]|jgi:hypothetical protein|uniref:hypothetical protein n=1 Tax=Gelidibacter japonicus TaxID=1962232 RepID=UPI0020216971|nr:hypothetical protein [Gelidibacter japonicus]MCL8008297.1 hypothetical protein [Gelidibacter japonicus]
MTLFDQLFFNSFNHYKRGTYKKKANSIAIVYITIVQASFLLVLGVFFAEFFHQMHVSTMSATKAWILYALACLLLYFINWIQYSGKKRKIMNANQKKKSNYGIWTLWLIPSVALFLAMLFLRVF